MAHYPKEQIEEIFEQYAQGVPMLRLSKQYKIARPSLMLWAKKYKWKERREKIQEKQFQKIDNSIAEIKAQGIKVFQDTMTLYAKKLKEGKVYLKPQDAVVVHKHILHLKGESETSQTVTVDLDSIIQEWDRKRKAKRG